MIKPTAEYVRPSPIIWTFMGGIIVAVTSSVMTSAIDAWGLTIALSVGLALVPAALIFARTVTASLDFAEPGIWASLYYFIIFGVRAWWIILFGSAFLGLPPEPTHLGAVNIALLVALLGLISFVVGYIAFHCRIVQAFPILPRQWEKRLVFPASLVLSLLGWTIKVYLAIRAAGSLPAYLTANKDALLRAAQGVSYLGVLSELSTVGLLMAFIWRRFTHSPMLTFWVLILLIPEVFWRIISGSRAQLIFLLMQLLIAYYLTSAQRGLRLTLKLGVVVVITLIVGVLIFPFLTTLRFEGLNAWRKAVEAVGRTMADPRLVVLVTGGRFHDLDALAEIIERVPRESPYLSGFSYLLTFVAFIPRAVWSEKPVISLGKILADTFFSDVYGGTGTAASTSLVGELYWNFGVIGVPFGMAFFGYLWRVAYNYLVKPHGNLSTALVTSAIFPAFFISMEQSFAASFSANLLKLALIVLVCFVTGKKLHRTNS